MIYPTQTMTSMGKVYNHRKTIKAIQEAILLGNIKFIESKPDNDVILMLMISDTSGSVDIYNHPMYYVKNNIKYLVGDFRSFVKKNTHPSDDLDIVITNKASYNLLKTIMLLTAEWLSSPVEVKINSFLAYKLYVEVISGSLLFQLNPLSVDMPILKIIIAAFYHDLHYEEKDNNKLLRLKDTLKFSGIKGKLVTDTLDKLPIMDSIADLAKAIADNTESESLKVLTPAMIFTSIADITYGYHIKDYIGVALEHPPTWAAIVAENLNDKSYKKTTLSRSARNFKRKFDGDNLIKYIEKLDNKYF